MNSFQFFPIKCNQIFVFQKSTSSFCFSYCMLPNVFVLFLAENLYFCYYTTPMKLNIYFEVNWKSGPHKVLVLTFERNDNAKQVSQSGAHFTTRYHINPWTINSLTAPETLIKIPSSVVQNHNKQHNGGLIKDTRRWQSGTPQTWLWSNKINMLIASGAEVWCDGLLELFTSSLS